MKRKLKFNFIDFLLCVFVLIFVGKLTSKYSLEFKDVIKASFNNSKVIIKVETLPIKKEYMSNIVLNQNVIDYKDCTTLGKITDIAFIDYSSDSLSYSNDYFCALITIDSNAEQQHSGYYTSDGKKLLVNEISCFAVPDLYFDGKIVSVNITNNKTVNPESVKVDFINS